MTENNKRDWNSTAAGWKKWHPISERAARTATEIMLKMAGVSEGYRVVDLQPVSATPRLPAQKSRTVRARVGDGCGIGNA